MAEKFKALGKDVRLSSTKGGHVVIIGQEFCEVPDVLVKHALAANCIPETVYNQMKEDMKDEVRKELALENQDDIDLTEAINNAEPPTLAPELEDVAEDERIDPPADSEAPAFEIDPKEKREADIVLALTGIKKLKDQGMDETPSGKKLEYRGKPRVEAVSELAGFKVSGTEVDEMLKPQE